MIEVLLGWGQYVGVMEQGGEATPRIVRKWVGLYVYITTRDDGEEEPRVHGTPLALIEGWC